MNKIRTKLVSIRHFTRDNNNELTKGLVNVNHSAGDTDLPSPTKLKTFFDSIKVKMGLPSTEEDEPDGINETSEFGQSFNLPNQLFDFLNPKAKLTDTNDFYDNSEKFLLHLAAKEGAIDRIKEIVLKDEFKNPMSLEKFINAKDKWNGFTALHLAARYNQVEVADFLIAYKASIDIPDGEDGNTPLLLAAKYGKTNAAKFLIEKGANVITQNNYGSTALHYASRRGNEALVSIILSKKGNVNIPDNNMATPLHLAVIGGYECVVNILIKNGAKVNAKDYKGQQPIHYLAASTKDDIRAEKNKGECLGSPSAIRKITPQRVASSIIGDLFDLLIKGACLKKKYLPERYESKKIKFVNSITVEKETPLHIAACCGNETCLIKLIQVGAKVNSQTESGSTPLHLAAIRGQKRAVKMLLNNKSNIQALDNNLMTPMHRACQYGRLLVVKLLNKRGALLDVKDKNNYTPLMCAVWKGHVEVVKYLIDRDVQIKSTDANNKNVFHIAVQEKKLDVLDLLSELDCIDIMNNVDNEYRTPAHYAAAEGNVQALDILIKKKASIDICEINKRTPLHLAAENGHLSCVKLLISTSAAEVNSTDFQGKTPLHLAVSNNHKKVVNLLIESGADVCLRDKFDLNSLDYAAQCGYDKVAQTLLDNGAFVDACSENGYTPLHHAARSGHVDCITTLLKHGANVQLRTKIENKNCFDLAVENLKKEACMAILNRKRWHEALVLMDNREIETNNYKNGKENEREETYVMEKIIDLVPDIGEVVLNKCITYSKHDKTDLDYFIEYNFEFVDSSPTNCQKQFFAPSLMVNFQRGNLLAHPLIVELINQKWSRMGRWMYLGSFSVYLLFVILLTTFAVTGKMNPIDKLNHPNNTGNDTSNYQTYCKNLPIKGIRFTLSIAIAQILSKLILAIYIGRNYIVNPAKILDFLLYISTALYMVPLIDCKKNPEKMFVDPMALQAGSVSILLAWFKFLIYIENLPFLGLYVVMFKELGLAVGDIEAVRKNAYLRVLQRKVYYLNILDQTYPKFIKKYVYQKTYKKKPNIKNLYKKVMLWLAKFHKEVLVDDPAEAKKDLIMREFAANKEAIMKQNKKTKSLLDDLEKQLKRNKKIAKHIASSNLFKHSTYC
ncbi:serine/threonine-protein phosphatase 6 regulatory ankyrin repeat subunit B-like isoform X2 [Hydra vulgaris]|uniref:Serine/threonine-protein phosphatase 6 regulatory ankyrin repeat subunit B-like isoform X2 n=1 Tax=Hydra vulgaris TaxID=6087 RepID=A0ABM4BKG6_HYDVU